MTEMTNLRYIVGTVRAGVRITGLVLATPGTIDRTPDVVMLPEMNAYLLKNKAILVNAKIDALNQVYFNSKTDGDTYVIMTNTAYPVSFLGRSSRRLHPGNTRKDANGNYAGVSHSYIVTDILSNDTKVQVMNDKGRLAEMNYTSFMKYISEGLIISNAKVENDKLVLLSKALHEYIQPDISSIIASKPAAQPVQNNTTGTASTQPATQPVQPTVVDKPIAPTTDTTIPDLTPPPIIEKATAGDTTNRKPLSSTQTETVKPLQQTQIAVPTGISVQKKRSTTAWIKLDTKDTVEQTTISRWLQQDDPDINLRLSVDLAKIFPSVSGIEFFNVVAIGKDKVLKYAKHADYAFDFTTYAPNVEIEEYILKWKAVLEQISLANHAAGKLNTIKIQYTWKGEVITAADYQILYREPALINTTRVLDYSNFDLVTCKKSLRYTPKPRPMNVWFIVLPNKEVNKEWTELAELHSIVGQIDYIDTDSVRAYEQQNERYFSKIPSILITTHPTFHPKEIQGDAFGLNLGAMYGVGFMKDITATLDLSSTFIRFLPQEALNFNFAHNLIIKLPDTCTRIHKMAINCREGYKTSVSSLVADKYLYNYDGNNNYSSPVETAYKLRDISNAARKVKLIGSGITRIDEVGYSIIYANHGNAYRHDFYLDISECKDNITSMTGAAILLDSLPIKVEKYINTLEPVPGNSPDIMPCNGDYPVPNYLLGHWSDIGKGKIKTVLTLSADELKKDSPHHANITVSGTIKTANIILINNSDRDTFEFIDNLTFEEGIEDITIFLVYNVVTRSVRYNGSKRLTRVTTPTGPDCRIKNVILPASCKSFKTLQPSCQQPLEYIQTVYYAEGSIMETYLKNNTGFAELAIPYKYETEHEDDMLTNLLGGSVEDAITVSIDYNFAKTNLTSVGVAIN